MLQTVGSKLGFLVGTRGSRGSPLEESSLLRKTKSVLFINSSGKSQMVGNELSRLGEQMVNSVDGTRVIALELCREFEDKFLQHIATTELGFMVIALIWKIDFSPFMVLTIAILNDGIIMTISKDRVKPSPTPDSWKLKEIFASGAVYGSYLALMMIIFFWVMRDTDFFSDKFGVRSIRHNGDEMMSALYLQVSIVS